MPLDKVHPKTFVGSNRHFQKPKAHLIAIQRHNRAASGKQARQAVRRMKAKNTKTRAKLAEMGIDYDFSLPDDKVGDFASSVCDFVACEIVTDVSVANRLNKIEVLLWERKAGTIATHKGCSRNYPVGRWPIISVPPPSGQTT